MAGSSMIVPVFLLSAFGMFTNLPNVHSSYKSTTGRYFLILLIIKYVNKFFVNL